MELSLQALFLFSWLLHYERYGFQNFLRCAGMGWTQMGLWPLTPQLDYIKEFHASHGTERRARFLHTLSRLGTLWELFHGSSHLVGLLCQSGQIQLPWQYDKIIFWDNHQYCSICFHCPCPASQRTKIIFDDDKTQSIDSESHTRVLRATVESPVLEGEDINAGKCWEGKWN